MFIVKSIKRFSEVDWDLVEGAHIYKGNQYYKQDENNPDIYWRFYFDCEHDRTSAGCWHLDYTLSNHDFNDMRKCAHKNPVYLKRLTRKILDDFRTSPSKIENDLFEFCGIHHHAMIIREKANKLFFEIKMYNTCAYSDEPEYQPVVYEVERKLVPQYEYSYGNY